MLVGYASVGTTEIYTHAPKARLEVWECVIEADTAINALIVNLIPLIAKHRRPSALSPARHPEFERAVADLAERFGTNSPWRGHTIKLAQNEIVAVRDQLRQMDEPASE